MLRWLQGALALVGGFVVALTAGDVRASVSIAATWDGLLQESTAAVVTSPIESQSVWEGGRIYTYTHLRVDRAVAGGLPNGSDVWVRTLGGVVGKIGQIVDGEPVFVPGRSSLVFLHPGPIGAFEVTARGQGQFPVVADDPKVPARVVRSNTVGAILPRPATTRSRAGPGGAGDLPSGALRLAAEVVHGRTVDDVARDIVADWARTHASQTQ
jgi:hypothetical protein